MGGVIILYSGLMALWGYNSVGHEINNYVKTALHESNTHLRDLSTAWISKNERTIYDNNIEQISMIKNVQKL